uniref:MFS transporter n=1 Tax=Escherichia coli TaxID=562 RepID=UPI0013D5263F
LQCGYPAGYLLAAVVYGLLYGQKVGDFTIGWRFMFLLSFVPALIVLFIRSHVPESPAFVEGQKTAKPGLLETLQKHWGIALYAVVLM